MHGGSCHPKRTTGQPLRILSWNIQHGGGKRAAAISRALTSWNPDCVVLVELRASSASRTIAAHLANLGLTHQLDTTRAHDPRHNGLLIASRFALTPLPMTGILAELGRWLPVEVHAPLPFQLIGMGIPNRDTKRKYEVHDAAIAALAGMAHVPGLAIGDTNTGLRHRRREQVQQVLQHPRARLVLPPRQRRVDRRLSHALSYGTRLYLAQHVQTSRRLPHRSSLRNPRNERPHPRHPLRLGRPERPSDHAAVLVDLDDE